MATLPATISRICDDLSRPESEIGASVRREILSAIEHYTPERFAFNERTLQFSLSASVDAYSLASIITANEGADPAAGIDSIIGIDRVRLYRGGYYYTLDATTWGELSDMRDANVVVGDPGWWAVFNKTLYFESSVGSDAGLGYVEGHVKLKPLDDSDTAENAWLQEGRELIAARASAMVCRKKLQDFELAQAFDAVESNELASLVQRATKLTSSGRIRGSW